VVSAIVGVAIASGDWVASAITPRMAASNPLEGKPATTDDAVASERLDRVA